MKNLLFVAIASTLVLTGCNTINGLGEDLTRAGSAISNTANKASNTISGKKSSDPHSYAPYAQ